MAVDRKLLRNSLYGAAYLKANNSERDLLNARDIQQFALDPNNFGGGKAGAAGLVAQLGAAGSGAYAQYKAKKEIVDNEIASQNAFAAKFPQYAELAGQLSPETRQAYAMEAMKSDLKQNDPLEQLKLQKEKADINKIYAETNKLNKEASGKLVDPEKAFRNATALRQDYLTGSKNFQTIKEAHERVVTSAQDPSPAGDLSLIFNYVKAQDPGSTVREGEFAQAAASGSFGDRIKGAVNKVTSGERLSADQRNDFVVRSKKLYDQANKSQQKIASQYTDIAKRNGLNPQDVVVDFSTSLSNEDLPATSNKTMTSTTTKQPHPQAADALAILKQRGVIK